MSFRIWTIFWVFALVASALATFGAGGVYAAAIVMAIWAWRVYLPKGKLSTLVVIVVVLHILIPLMLLLLPTVQFAREAARRAQCQNNLKQVALTLHSYHMANGRFPPPFTVDTNGKPLHSRRTLI